MAKTNRGGSRGDAAGQGEPMCTFCCKNHREVEKLIGGPGIYICNECVGLCNDILTSTGDVDTSAGWQGWDALSDDELLAMLPGSLQSVEHVRADLQARIDTLRRRKVSWAKIGNALGMSRQAAWERFA